MSTIPEKNWGSTSKPSVTTQFGCVYCLAEGNHGPLDIVYTWKGTTLCFNHVAPEAKANPNK